MPDFKPRIERRAATVERAGIDRDSRTVSLAFSSEAPVERAWGREVLDHDPRSVRLGRLTDGGPVLLDHDPTKHIGVVEQVRIGKDRVGRAVVRFGRGPEADAAFRDVVDGIRRHVSVGYQIHDAVEEMANGQSVYRVKDWEPYELSLVAIPADASVGIGRSAPDLMKGSSAMTIATTTATTSPDAAQIRAIGEQYRNHISEADELRHILAGSSAEEFRQDILKRMETSHTDTRPIGAPAIVGNRNIERFSLAKFLRQTASDTLDGVERELSREAARNASGLGMVNPLPLEALATRNLVVGTATIGGNLVATDLRDDLFATLLRNRAMTVALGARVLSGLSSNVDIPRQTAGATAQWLAETGTATASDPTFAKLSLTPKRVSAFVVASKQLIAQSSVAIEDMLRRDIVAQIAVAVDAAMVNGSGASNQPRGILNTTSVSTATIGANGGDPTWSTLVEMERLVADQNADMGSLGYLTNSRVRSKLKRTLRGTNLDYIWSPADSPADGVFSALNGYRAAVSNNVPNNLTKGTSTTACSAIVFGDWTEAIIAQFGAAVDITVDPYSLAPSGEVRIVAHSFLDCGVRQPGSFSVVVDALTT
jgi:HK97 family phage major capsid protein